MTVVGDTGIEPVTSTVSMPIHVVDRCFAVMRRSSDQRGYARQSVVLVARATASADFLLTAACRSVPVVGQLRDLVPPTETSRAWAKRTRCGTWFRAG
jgi:hypothetical protein